MKQQYSDCSPAHLRCLPLGVGLQVFAQADEGYEQRRRLKEAHVVDVHAVLVEGTPVEDGDDGVDVGRISSQRDQDIHVCRATPQCSVSALVKMPSHYELQQAPVDDPSVQQFRPFLHRRVPPKKATRHIASLHR